MTQCRAVWLLGSTTVNIPLQFLDPDPDDFQNLMAISLSKSPELFSGSSDRIQLYVKLQTQAPTPPGQPGSLSRYSPSNWGKHHVLAALPFNLSEAYFDVWSSSATIALMTFIKCIVLYRCILHVSYNTILFFANYVNLIHIRTNCDFFLHWSTLAVHLNFAAVLQTQSRRLVKLTLLGGGNKLKNTFTDILLNGLNKKINVKRRIKEIQKNC